MSKLVQVTNGEYIGANKYTIKDAGGGKSTVDFAPDSVIREGTPVGAELLNEIQKNSIPSLEAVRRIEGQDEVYDCQVEGIDTFAFDKINFIVNFDLTNTKTTPFLRIGLLKYPIKFLEKTLNLGDLDSGNRVLLVLDKAKQIANIVSFLSDNKNKANVVATIEELKSSTRYKVGDIVEVLGYYEKGDGADHKRKIESADDGSGVELANGLFANIVISNNIINLKWLGCKNNEELSQYFIKVQKIEKLYSDSWFGYTIIIPKGSYTFNKQVEWEQTRVINIIGEGMEQSVFIDFRNLPTNSYAFYFKLVTPINYRLPHFSIKNIMANGFDCNAGFVKSERSIFSVFENIWLQGFKPTQIKVFSLTNDSHFFEFKRIKILGCNNVFGFNISEGHRINNCWFDACDGIDFRGTRQTSVENTDFETGNKNIYTGDRNRFKIHFERNGSSGGTNDGETLVNVGNDTELDFNCALDGGTQHYPIKFIGDGATVKLSGRALTFIEPTMASWSNTNKIVLRDLSLFTNSLEEVVFKNIESKRGDIITEGTSINMITNGNATFEKDIKSDGCNGVKITNTTGSTQRIKVEMAIPSCPNVAFSSLLYKNIAGSSIKTIKLYFGNGRVVSVTKPLFSEYMVSMCNSIAFGDIQKIEFTEDLPNGHVRFIKYPIVTEDFNLAKNFNISSGINTFKLLDTPYYT